MPGQRADPLQEREKYRQRDKQTHRHNYISRAERIRSQDRHLNSGYNRSRDDRSSSRNCSQTNYSYSRQRQNSKDRKQNYGNRDSSPECHAQHAAPNYKYNRSHSQSPYPLLQPRYASNGREHYMITEKSPKDIHIKVYTQEPLSEN
jgi:hypothetical protein